MQNGTVSEPLIKWMGKPHLPQVLMIEREVFEHPWTEGEFNRLLNQKNVKGIFAEVESEIIGYALFEKTGSTMHIQNVGVTKAWQRKGVGQALVEKIKQLMPAKSVNRIILEVRETNFPAQVFFRKLGFKATGIAHDLYDEVEEDAYVFHFSRNVAPAIHKNRVAACLKSS